MFLKIAHIRRDCNNPFVGLEVCSFSLLRTVLIIRAEGEQNTSEQPKADAC